MPLRFGNHPLLKGRSRILLVAISFLAICILSTSLRSSYPAPPSGHAAFDEREVTLWRRWVSLAPSAVKQSLVCMLWQDLSLGGRSMGNVEDPGLRGFIARIDTVDVDLDLHLTEVQCDKFFPGFFKEIDRAKGYYSSRGGIKKEWFNRTMKNRGHGWVVIHNNRMYVRQSNPGPWTRAQATLAQINQAVITSLEPIPDVEFVFKSLDHADPGDEESALVTLNRHTTQEDYWVMPDFGFYSWPEVGAKGMLHVRDSTLKAESRQTWSDKIPRLLWKGAAFNPVRLDLLAISKDQPWSAVSEIDWERAKQDAISPADHCKYKYLGHAEGNAYSGRLKYLLMCRSVVVAHAEPAWITHFSHLIDTNPNSPGQNMVETPGPLFGGLEETMKHLMNDEDRAERIANTSSALFRHYLSPASTNCYWRKFFKAWSEAQAFKVEKWDNDTDYASFDLINYAHTDMY